ncbi:Thoeris anti-defense Tad2 family protein [Eremococcus coleocola]|uniref:Thoeris anti-defense Tad2 family protein n=1 Tax=Eremococcus coleocola TaxID=88132 RepID=UPI0004873558|nr:hypothetical protein [Eremococcus coleocola]
MNIVDAIKNSNGKPITRQNTNYRGVQILPTNDRECCLVFIDKIKKAPRWNPNRDDLIANDWIVLEEWKGECK